MSGTRKEQARRFLGCTAEESAERMANYHVDLIIAAHLIKERFNLADEQVYHVLAPYN